MNIADLISLARTEVLDDAIEPFLWSDIGLVAFLNRAYEELCRESWCLIDSTTTAVTQINLLSNLTNHSLHAKVLHVFNSRRESDGGPIYPKSERYLDSLNGDWRSLTGNKPIFRVMDLGNRIFGIYPKYDTTGYIAGSSNITFTVAAGPVYTINQAGATFTSHFSTGDSVVVTGSTSNNGTFTITNVATTALTVTEALTNESNTSAILRLVRDVALLKVARLPLTPWTANDLEDATPPSPEIDDTYHVGLLDGIARWAYMKQDTEVYDPQRAQRHKEIFDDFKSMVRWDILTLMEGETVNQAHYGNL